MPTMSGTSTVGAVVGGDVEVVGGVVVMVGSG
jgi:hypothetical protein